MLYRTSIPLPPVTKKNSQRILRSKNRPFIAPSAKYADYETAAIWYIKKPEEPIAEPVNVKCSFYMPTHRKVDLVNLQEAILDILVHAGVLSDDNSKVVVSMDGSRVLYDKEHPRTEVEIEKCN